jgi:hypothetical protein
MLEDLDRITAAGILARAALAMTDSANPAAALVFPDEQKIRNELIYEMRRRYGISDDSAEARERLSDVLDQESDELLGPIDDKVALERLARNGDLPSDLYQVSIVSNVEALYGAKFPAEKARIEETVKSPDLEQHWGPTGEDSPTLISIFAKTFHDRYPVRSFVMLVAGERRDLSLLVLQAWRIYPEDVDLAGAKSPLDMLERFASVYGHDVTVGNRHGRFIYLTDILPGTPVPVTGFIPAIPGKHTRQVNLTFFAQPSTDKGRRAALVVGIDLDKYRDALAKRGW